MDFRFCFYFLLTTCCYLLLSSISLLSIRICKSKSPKLLEPVPTMRSRRLWFLAVLAIAISASIGSWSLLWCRPLSRRSERERVVRHAEDEISKRLGRVSTPRRGSQSEQSEEWCILTAQRFSFFITHTGLELKFQVIFQTLGSLRHIQSPFERSSIFLDSGGLLIWCSGRSCPRGFAAGSLWRHFRCQFRLWVGKELPRPSPGGRNGWRYCAAGTASRPWTGRCYGEQSSRLGVKGIFLCLFVFFNLFFPRFVRMPSLGEFDIECQDHAMSAPIWWRQPPFAGVDFF